MLESRWNRHFPLTHQKALNAVQKSRLKIRWTELLGIRGNQYSRVSVRTTHWEIYLSDADTPAISLGSNILNEMIWVALCSFPRRSFNACGCAGNGGAEGRNFAATLVEHVQTRRMLGASVYNFCANIFLRMRNWISTNFLFCCLVFVVVNTNVCKKITFYRVLRFVKMCEFFNWVADLLCIFKCHTI